MLILAKKESIFRNNVNAQEFCGSLYIGPSQTKMPEFQVVFLLTCLPWTIDFGNI